MPWPWVILGRVPRLVPGDAQAAGEAEVEADAQAGAEGDEEADAAAHAADFYLPVVLPPRVTVMRAAPTAHPDPNNPDKYPYILAVDAACILFNFGVKPFYGVCFDEPPYESNLIVVRPSNWGGAVQQGHPAMARAKRIPRRDGKHSVISNIESIGFVTIEEGPDDYVIAELMINRGSDRATLVYIHEDSDKWRQEDTPNPLPDRGRDWVPSGVVAHGEMLWWFDLSWGIISFDPHDGLEVPRLRFHHLPEGRALDMFLPGIHDRRCITESQGELQFVEIIPGGEGEPEAATVVTMWTRLSDDGDNSVTMGWHLEHQVSFADIWNDEGYMETGLPRTVPAIVAVSPSNRDIVYFVLQQEECIFSVDLVSRIVHQFVDEDYDLVTPLPAPPNCRYVLPWYLPLDVAQALGMDPFGNYDAGDQLAEEIDARLLEQLLEDEENEDDDDVQEAEFQYDVQMAEGINAELDALADEEEMQEAEIDDEEMQDAEIHDDEELQQAKIHDDHELLEDDPSEELMRRVDMMSVGVKMDPETLSRLQAEVKEFAEEQAGPSQDP